MRAPRIPAEVEKAILQEAAGMVEGVVTRQVEDITVQAFVLAGEVISWVVASSVLGPPPPAVLEWDAPSACH